MRKRPKDKIEGDIIVGISEDNNVVISLDKDYNGTGHIVFSPNQARELAILLLKKAQDIEKDLYK